MTSIYITALRDSGGKTTLAAGLARALVAEGKQVGFLKPLLVSERPTPGTTYPDVDFMRQLLGLGEAADALCPLAIVPSPSQAKDGEVQELANILRDAYSALLSEKDVVIVEGPRSSPSASSTLARSVDAKVILLAAYTLATKDEIAQAALAFGDSLLGVVLNQVPPRRMAPARSSLAPSLAERGIRVLGIIADDRLLFTLTIGELAQHLGAEVLAGKDHLDGLIENLMIGALTADPAAPYLARRSGKAVVTRADRPDIQLATLNTDVRCLILAGPAKTLPEVLNRAQDRGVAVIQVKDDVITTVGRIDEALTATTFHQEQKLKHLDRLLAESFDFQAFYLGLGLNDS